MIRNRHIFFAFLFCIAQQFCFSQNSRLDSLLTFIKTTTSDSAKVNTLNTLCLYFEYTDDVKALEMEKKAVELAQKIDYKKGLAMAYMYGGYLSEDKGNYPEALKNYYASLKIREAIQDKGGIADSYFCIGNIYYFQENYPEAFKKFTSSLKIYKETGNMQNIATAYNNIGGVYFHQQNYYEALKKYSEALNMRKKLGDARGVADSYGNIGNVYSDQKDYAKALEVYFTALKTMGSEEDKAFTAGICSNIGMVYTKLKKNKEAEEYLLKAIALSKEIGYKECLKSTYNGLAELDSAKGDFKSAYENRKLFIIYKDSIDNEDTREKTIQSQMTYDFEKREAVATVEHKKELENQEALADEKSRKQKIVLTLVLGSLLLVIIFAGFILKSLRTTRKQKDIIEEQKNIVEMQKQEVELQKTLVEEHQKAIIDSITYARRIQYSLLPTDKYIEKNLNRLNKKKS